MNRAKVDQKTNKMWFLQFLRGVACLLIVYVHWLTFLLNPTSVSELVSQSKIQAYDVPVIIIMFAGAVNKILPVDFREVYFGLGLFFLISGFIIPISLGKGSRANFVIRRVARILPVAIVCTVITALMIFIGRWVEGNSTAPFPLVAIFSNALLVRDLLRMPFIDTAIWTLEVEVHFYIICLLISFFSGHKKAWVILGLCLGFLMVSLFVASSKGDHWMLSYYLNLIVMNGAFLGLMFVGMALYNFGTGNWSLLKTSLVVAVLMILNNLTLQNYSDTTAGVVYGNHVYAVMVFIILLLGADRIPYFKFLDKLANISYPLYLLHGSCGYTLFYMIYKVTSNISVSLIMSFAAIMTLTVIVHKTVELRSTPVGKKIARFVDERSFFAWGK